ncbi:spore coat protein F [Clostridium gelidum]|uniref:Spore coat protein F n=1 Tax=Clostridium gelidum TaxID=704125 RepID=A0ABM7TC91_9CLOT|nr:spore coat protein [Clostridium gelidum]BCZ48754.1 spore coat protein F [Clostridium gelidum]
MNDKDLLEDILLTVKGGSDLYLHGTIESATPNIHSVFDKTLNDSLKMQNEIYNKMSSKGWYPAQQAEQTKIDQARQKFSAQ